MTFVKTTWNDDALPDLTAAQLNRMEQGIADAHLGVASGTMQRIADFASIGGGRLRLGAIPQTFKHLRVVAQLQSQAAGSTNAFIQFNGITTATYRWAYFGMNQAAAYQGAAGGQTYAFIGLAPGANRANDNFLSNYIIDIPNYSLADCIKTSDAHAVGSNGAGEWWSIKAGTACEATASPITTMDIGEVSASGLGPRSKATLYGIV